MKLTKAAMFGLDARIALAIFGALSVISGAALYSAIKAAKTEQLRQYFEERIKASTQYYLDTGKELPKRTGDSNDYIYAVDMAENRESLSSWNGSYVEGSLHFTQAIKDSYTATVGSNAYYWILLRQSSDWAQMDDNDTDEKCAVDSTDCSEWHAIYAGSGNTATMLQLFADLDELVDNSDGALTGKVRYNTAYDDYIMYKGRLRKGE